MLTGKDTGVCTEETLDKGGDLLQFKSHLHPQAKMADEGGREIERGERGGEK